MKTKKILVSAALLAACMTAPAQGLLTGYFVDNYKYGHRLNPAFASDQGYAGVLLSNIQAGISSNIEASSIYHILPDGSTAYFLHPDISADDAMKRFSKDNFISQTLDYNLVNIGINMKHSGCLTIDLSLKERLDVNIPYEFFNFLKAGMNSASSHYNIENFQIYQHTIIELAGGYSRDIKVVPGGLRVGGKVKLQAIADDACLNIDHMDITMDRNAWTVKTKAHAAAHIGGMRLTTDQDGYVDGVKFDVGKIGVAGYGVALDLGASYSFKGIVDGLEASVALQDLQLLRVFSNSSVYAVTDDNTFTFDGFQNLTFQDDDKIEDRADKIADDAKELIKLKPGTTPKTISPIKTANPTLTIAARYKFLRNMMSAGLLYRGEYNNLRSSNIMMANWNFSPARWFNVSLSALLFEKSTYLGCLVNITPRRGLNIFFGMDGIPTQMVNNYIPSGKIYSTFQMGITIPFGEINAHR